MGARRALLLIGFGGIALAGAACSDGGVLPPQTSCAPSTGSLSIPAAGTQLSNGTTVGSGATATTMTLTSSQCASVVGQEVTYTATLSWPAGATTPTSPPGYVSIGTSDGTTQTAFTGCDKLELAPASGSTSATVTCRHTFSSISSQTIVAASYNGDATFAPSGGGYVQTVNQAPTTTAVTASPASSSVFGQDVTFTAAVSATTSGTPTGSVVFSDNGSPIACTGGTQTLDNNGGATCTTGALTVGTHTVTATYQGDVSYLTSTSAPGISQTVSQAASTTAVSSSANPSVVGQPVTFTATVAAGQPGSGTPTGDVQFAMDGTDLGSPVALANGVATSSSIGSLSPGPHAITASYQGDADFTASTTASALSQTVNQAPTTTGLSALPATGVFGQSVTFTATVTVDTPGAGAPTGTVAFSANGKPISCTDGTQALDSGAATCTTSALPAGNDQVTATYQGDSSFATSASTPLSQQVDKAATTTALASASTNPSVAGQAVTFTASVSVTAPGAGVPTGAVAFFDDGNSLGTGQLSSQGGSVQATLTTPAVSVGSRAITATYQGDDDFATSPSSAVSQQVNQASTTTALVSAANPSVFGQPVTFTATVTPSSPGSGTPTGDVQFVVDGTASGSPVALSAGSASTPGLSTLPVGTHTVTATYQGDGSFLGSTTGTALSQVVSTTATTTTVSSSANPSVSGQPVSFTATVAPVTVGAGVPAGTVVFTLDGVAQPSASLSAGQASFTATTPPSVGSHIVSAAYGGNANFTPSATGSALTQRVNQASTTTAVSTSASSSAFGRGLTFTAAMTVNAPGAGTRAGAVDFTDNGRPLGAGVIGQDGRATVATSALIPGDHTIAATFRGDTRLLPSSGTLRQMISCAVISGTRTTAVTVSQATCLQGATLNAGVTINPGGSLLVDHSQVNGPVVSDRAVAVRICASSVSSNVSLTRSSGFVLLGDGADNDVGVAPCGGNTIKGVANLANGSSPVQLGGNFVTGMNLTANTGSPARLERNHVTGTLACAGNAPAPTDNGEPNVAGARLGQCGAPGF